MPSFFARLWDWLRCQTAYELTASRKRTAVLTARAFLHEQLIPWERMDNAYVVRNEAILPRLASDLGQKCPEGKIWQVFFVPSKDSTQVNKSANRIIVVVDDKSKRCCLELRE